LCVYWSEPPELYSLSLHDALPISGLMEKLMSVAIVGFGALLVFEGEMTVGALVAFNMLAGRVSGPLTQIVTMAHEYQEVALSVRDRKSTRLNSSHVKISYAVFCLK